jgi:DNA-binding CsgD family transcriptional regulator
MEREAQLERLVQWLGRAKAGEGELVLIEGPAGIGKTALVRAVCTFAGDQGVGVFDARGHQLEDEFAFGVVRQLLERPLAAMSAAEQAALLAGAAAPAALVVAPGLRRAAAAQGGEPSLLGTLHGLYWLVVNLAERGPLLLCIDDAHWADRASLRFVDYLARRLADLPVALLVASRRGEPSTGAALLPGLIGNPSVEVLEPMPLSEEAVGAIVRRVLPGAVADEFCAACHGASGGNPFLLEELLAELKSEGIEPTTADARRVALIHPGTVTSAVLARLGRLGRDASRLARALAVLGDAAELRFAAALAGSDMAEAARAVDTLARADILAPGSGLGFAHPLVRGAIYESIPAAQRAHDHARAARLLADEGVATERVAAQLLMSEPGGDAQSVALLRDAAARARAVGAPSVAGVYLRRAVAEPPPAAARAEVLFELGQVERLAGDGRAAEHLREALAEARDPAAHARVALTLGQAEFSAGRLADAGAVFDAALDQLGDDHRDLALQLEAYRSGLGNSHPEFAAALARRADRLRELAESGGASGRALCLVLGLHRVFAGASREEILRLVERGLDGGRFIAQETADGPAPSMAVRALMFIDELDHAERLLADMVANARTRGSVTTYATATVWRAGIALRRGVVDLAESEARAAVALAAEPEVRFIAPHAHAFLGEALLEQGKNQDAVRLLEDVELGTMRGTRPETLLLHARARARLATRHVDAAIADLRTCQHIQEALPLANPNVLAWRSALALALPATARDEASALIDAELSQARAVGQPRAIGVALRAHALLAERSHSIELLCEAVAVLERSPARLDHTRTLADLGATLRRSGHRREARAPLSQALELAHRAGATALAARARDELQAAGARPRRLARTGLDALTPAERRTAHMAAAGMTNREIAQALFITMNTVATHLSHVYQKLDITSRNDLTRAPAESRSGSR